MVRHTPASIHRSQLARLVLLACALSVAWTGQATARSGDDAYATHDRITRVEHNLQGWARPEGTQPRWTLPDRMKTYGIQGLAIAVIHDYKLEWSRFYGFADVASGRPVTDRTLFQAGSASKAVNAVGALRLAEERRLDLARDVNAYLTTWKFPYDSLSKGRPIGIASLLSHTAGLNALHFGGYPAGDTLPSLVQTLDGVSPARSQRVRSEFEPGRRYQYTGAGALIVQQLVGDLSGMPYAEYMRTRVLEPLGMSSSFFDAPPPARWRPQLATGYHDDGVPVEGGYRIYPEAAAAGLWTTCNDLARFVIGIQLALRGTSGLLSRDMTLRMMQRQLDDVAPSGLGMVILNGASRRYFTHGGTNDGFVCQFVGSVEGGDGAVVMTNTDDSGLYDEILNSIATIYGWPGYYRPVAKRVIVPDAATVRSCLGNYKIGEGSFQIVEQDGSMWMDVGNARRWRMYFTDESHFFVMEKRFEFEIVRDSAGRATTLDVNGQPIASKTK